MPAVSWYLDTLLSPPAVCVLLKFLTTCNEIRHRYAPRLYLIGAVYDSRVQHDLGWRDGQPTAVLWEEVEVKKSASIWLSLTVWLHGEAECQKGVTSVEQASPQTKQSFSRLPPRTKKFYLRIRQFLILQNLWQLSKCAFWFLPLIHGLCPQVIYNAY